MRATLAMAVLCVSPAVAGEGYARLEGHGGPIKGVAISSDGRHALTASFDNSVGLWSLQDAASEPTWLEGHEAAANTCLLYTSPSPRDLSTSRMPSSA